MHHNTWPTCMHRHSKYIRKKHTFSNTSYIKCMSANSNSVGSLNILWQLSTHLCVLWWHMYYLYRYSTSDSVIKRRHSQTEGHFCHKDGTSVARASPHHVARPSLHALQSMALLTHPHIDKALNTMCCMTGDKWGAICSSVSTAHVQTGLYIQIQTRGCHTQCEGHSDSM